MAEINVAPCLEMQQNGETVSQVGMESTTIAFTVKRLPNAPLWSILNKTLKLTYCSRWSDTKVVFSVSLTLCLTF